MKFSGKKVLVLGGTSGIGLATAAAFHDAGAEVVVLSRDPAKVADSARQVGADCVGVELDVLDVDRMREVFAAQAPFQIMVNAATGGERATGPFAKMDLAGFQGSFRKLWGYTNSVHAALPHISQDGAMVLVSGSPARKSPPGYSAISTVGNAVEGFVRAVAAEIAPVRLMAVSPGIIDTPMFPVEGDAREEFLQQATAANLIKRPGKAEEVAEGILFAAGNEFMTGSVIDIEGGALLP